MLQLVAPVPTKQPSPVAEKPVEQKSVSPLPSVQIPRPLAGPFRDINSGFW